MSEAIYVRQPCTWCAPATQGTRRFVLQIEYLTMPGPKKPDNHAARMEHPLPLNLSIAGLVYQPWIRTRSEVDSVRKSYRCTASRLPLF